MTHSRCLAFVKSKQNVDLHIQCLAVINSFLEDCDVAQAYIKERKTLFEDVVVILKENSKNYRAQDMCLRTIRNGIIKQIISPDEFLQVI